VKVSGHEVIPVTGWEGDEPSGDVDAQEWWFRAPLPRLQPEDGEEVVLCFDGLATVCDVFVDDEPVLESTSMFLRHEVPFRGGREVAIRCRPLPKGPREPRARWRTRIADSNLRWFRTTLIGRTSFAPGPPPVGPWRPVRIERRRRFAVDELRLRPRLDGDDGVLAIDISLRSLGPALPELEVEIGGDRLPLGEVHVAGVERWWPHTHGEPRLYDVRLIGDGIEIDAGWVGFRELDWDDGFRVNGVDFFARGAVWTRGGRETLERAREAGMNMLRLPGFGWYEHDSFWDLCDELGILVWQDFMFANFDYPGADRDFRGLVEAEARQVLAGIAGRPSLAILCGNSEVEQQAAMLGLEPKLARSDLFDELLPGLVREAGANVPYIPSTPCGGDLPFRTNRGVAHYYGVGAYRRLLSDARLAEVSFAAECLAFSNLPDGGQEGFVPRDAGADWDFADVREHYEPATTGEVMAEVFGEWRRAGSPCRGALVQWLRDLQPGAGWGVLDHEGNPKAAYHHLRRALAPVAVWTTDEGLNGIDVHVANDRAEPLQARLRVALYRDFELKVEEASEELDLAPHAGLIRNVEGLLGRFVDASYAYRFGPPGHDLVVASLESDNGLISQGFRLTAGRPEELETARALGLEASVEAGMLRLRSRRFAYEVRVHGAEASDDAFSVEPGGERLIEVAPGRVSLIARNLDGRLEVGS
jgi:beta-mannosidase